MGEGMCMHPEKVPFKTDKDLALDLALGLLALSNVLNRPTPDAEKRPFAAIEKRRPPFKFLTLLGLVMLLTACAEDNAAPSPEAECVSMWQRYCQQNVQCSGGAEPYTECMVEYDVQWRCSVARPVDGDLEGCLRAMRGNCGMPAECAPYFERW